MSADGMRRTMEGVELGSAEPTEDEEGISALPFGDLRLDPDSGDSESGECRMHQQAGGDGVSEDNGVMETFLIDDDEEVEDEEEHLSAFAELEGATLDDGEAKTETKASETAKEKRERKAQTQKNYANIVDSIFARLPAKGAVVARVTAGVKESCTGNKRHLATLAANLLGLAIVQAFVWNWWEFLKETLRKSAPAPPTSARAAMYTKERRDERESARSHFICHVDIRNVASTLSEGRKNRDLGGVFLVIENVIEDTLTQALHDANCVKVTYPKGTLTLDVNQKRVLYHIVGWLLSSALTRVKRDNRLRDQFLPFVNRHGYRSAEEFRRSHRDEEYRGLETVVEERNVRWEGKSLIFSSVPFFLFGLAVEAGYRACLENPILLATYHGDLGNEILGVVSTAPSVKSAWADCTKLVPDGRRGGDSQGINTDAFDALFEFVMRKWHNCRMYEYTRGLTSFRKELKRTKAASLRDDMALRDQVKGMVGSSRGKGRHAGSVNNGELSLTDAHRARAAVLAARTGSSAFQSFSVRDLRESIVECGVRPPSAMKKAELQLMLRSLAPGIGRDTDEQAEEGLGQPGGAGT